MIACRQLPAEAFVEIRFAESAGQLHGARVLYSADGIGYQPCAVYRGKDADSLLECSLWEWNQAAQFGNLKFNGKPRTVYWNLYLNRMHAHGGPVHIRVETLRESNVTTWQTKIELTPCRAVFLNDWKKWIPEGGGWKEMDGHLTLEPDGSCVPIRIQPRLKGRYAISFGIGYGTLIAHLKVSDEPGRCPFFAERNRAEFQDKQDKEILWKTAELNPDSALEISPTPLTLREPKKWPFGAIRYIKFAPSRKAARATARPKWADKTLALYFEPYSWAFVHGLHERWRVREAMLLYQEMGANEIHNQIIRFGSRSLHHGRVAERHDRGAMMGDDGTISPGPADMVRSLDVLRETIDVCRELGLTHYANAGLTNCYPGSDFEDRISREHPEWRTSNVLRFSHPETRAHAAGVIREFVEWGADGVSIDCMRYPYHHTEEELLAVFHEFHDAIAAASGARKAPLAARIPAGDIVYFRVFERLAREGLAQCVIPSTLFMREPRFSLKPYLKWKDFGCRVFGIIDGWLAHVGSFQNFQFSLNRNPRDIREDITRFLREGADGIFVYQADGHCADPFTRNALDWRRWRGRHVAG